MATVVKYFYNKSYKTMMRNPLSIIHYLTKYRYEQSTNTKVMSVVINLIASPLILAQNYGRLLLDDDDDDRRQ